MLASMTDGEILEIVYDVLNARYCDVMKSIERCRNKRARADLVQQAERLRWQKTEALTALIELEFGH